MKNMKEVNVLINDVDKILGFVNILEQCNVHAVVGQGSVVIDASSMIGVMTMDTRRPVLLTINEADEVADNVIEKIKSYIIE